MKVQKDETYRGIEVGIGQETVEDLGFEASRPTNDFNRLEMYCSALLSSVELPRHYCSHPPVATTCVYTHVSVYDYEEEYIIIS